MDKTYNFIIMLYSWDFCILYHGFDELRLYEIIELACLL